MSGTTAPTVVATSAHVLGRELPRSSLFRQHPAGLLLLERGEVAQAAACAQGPLDARLRGLGSGCSPPHPTPGAKADPDGPGGGLSVTGRAAEGARQLERMLEEASEGLETLRVSGDADPGRTAYLEGVMQRLGRRVALQGDGAGPLREVVLEAAWLESPPRGFPHNGLGGLEADLNPLIQYRGGRTYAHGVTGATEVEAAAAPTSWLTLQARPRVAFGSATLAPMDAEVSRVDFTMQRASARAVFGNLALVAGREPTHWGPAGGLLLSRNARPLDMLKLSGDAPFRLPGFLGRLGPTAFTFLGAHLGQERDHPGALMFAWKLSHQPHANFEFGTTMVNVQGGEGGPEAKLWERVLDVLSIVEILQGPDTEYLISEKIAGADVLVRVPSLDGLELYAEAAITDLDLRRAKQTFWEEAAYQAGVVLPRVGPRGAAQLRLEAQHSGVRMYRHHQYHSGLTFERRLIGSELGPDAKAGLLEVIWEGPALLTLQGTWESRSLDSYLVVDEPFEHNIIKDERRPQERRLRVVGRVETLQPVRSLHAAAEVGFERADNFAHQSGRSRSNALLRLQLGWRP